MLTENFIAATLTAGKPRQHLSSSLKDVGIFHHEFQPQLALRHGFKKSSVQPQCIAISESHIFAAQADKSVINVYSREKGNQEATVPLPDRITSLAYVNGAAILVIGTGAGKLLLWEISTGRVSSSTSSHLQGVSSLCLSPSNEYILSGSDDSTVFVWSLEKLVSFITADSSFGGEAVPNAPVRAFSNHRNSISALECGHSRPSTNFAVSASIDQTCYLWHIETCETLRTILLPSIPTCITLDPLDRAVYFGDDTGAVLFIDVLSVSAEAHKSHTSSVTFPIQIKEKNRWRSTADVGAVHCLALTYDGTTLLTGHANGTVVQWDIAKRRMVLELINLSQPITNIKMLRPDGLIVRRTPSLASSTVVKPKLEFNAQVDNGTCGIPARYDFYASLTGYRRLREDDIHSDNLRAITGDGWPDSVLDGAIRALDLGIGSFAIADGNDLNDVKVERLKDEAVDLKQQLAALQAVEERRNAKRTERMARREDAGAKRRAAYFEAKRHGRDGDAAMKPWEEEEDKIDAESDDEALQEKMDTG